VRTLPLQAFATVVLNAEGNGSSSIGPLSGGEVWPGGYNVAVHCATNTSEAQCKVYCGGSLDPQWFSDATTWGSTGDSTSNTRPLAVGQQVFASWNGGDPGTTAYLVVTGSKEVS
jgi:hypothetical protein